MDALFLIHKTKNILKIDIIVIEIGHQFYRFFGFWELLFSSSSICGVEFLSKGLIHFRLGFQNGVLVVSYNIILLAILGMLVGRLFWIDLRLCKRHILKPKIRCLLSTLLFSIIKRSIWVKGRVEKDRVYDLGS